MTVYTYSIARQKLATLLNEARRDGAVRIKRRDGSLFIVRPEIPKSSPFDVKGVKLGISTKEMIQAIRESRKRF